MLADNMPIILNLMERPIPWSVLWLRGARGLMDDQLDSMKESDDLFEALGGTRDLDGAPVAQPNAW